MKTIRVQTAGVAAGIAMMLALAMPARGDTRVAARVQVHPRPTEELQISVWPDRGEGAAYTIGDPIAMNVEVNRDCFLILYNIDTQGNLRILFPYDAWEDNLVRAGDVIRFPRPQDGYDWTVDGPEGMEYVQAIASDFPIQPPDWPVYLRTVNHGGAVHPDAELRDFRAGDDRLDYIRVVNHKIAGRYWDWCATDLATFRVDPRHYQQVTLDDDPWPSDYYGEVYIRWPAGGAIFIDGTYLGIAPLWVPRQYYGRHVITCYEGRRLLRRHAFVFHPKSAFHTRSIGRDYDGIRERGFVKNGRRGGVEQFRQDIDRYNVRREEYRNNAGNRRADDRGTGRIEQPNPPQRNDAVIQEREYRNNAGNGRTDDRGSGRVEQPNSQQRNNVVTQENPRSREDGSNATRGDLQGKQKVTNSGWLKAVADPAKVTAPKQDGSGKRNLGTRIKSKSVKGSGKAKTASKTVDTADRQLTPKH